MSKSVKRCLTFYKVLKKDRSFWWNKECEKAFIQLKEHLSSLLILTRPKVKETLLLYLTAFEKVIRTVLIVKRDGEQKPIYYTNKVLHGIEVMYQKTEKLAYAIVLASRRLKPYF